MPKYENHGGNSNVASSPIVVNQITVAFLDDAAYLYNSDASDPAVLQRMQGVALEGRELNSYVVQHIKKELFPKTSLRMQSFANEILVPIHSQNT